MINQGRHYGRLVFMVVVTAYLLAVVFGQAARGPAGLPAVVAYSLAAGFGLEFVCATWAGRTRAPKRRSSLSD